MKGLVLYETEDQSKHVSNTPQSSEHTAVAEASYLQSEGLGAVRHK